MSATGTATIDFGAFPGGFDASVVVTGQAAITGSSAVEAWLVPAVTADHSEDEQMLEPVYVFVPRSTVVAGTGFTIQARAEGVNRVYGQFNVGWVWV